MAKLPAPSSPWQDLTFRAIPIIGVIIAHLQTLAVLRCHAQDDPVLLWCAGETNYTAASQFKRNLDLLLAELRALPTPAARGHFHSASARGTAGPDTTYGLAQCRGDVNPDECAACLNRTASEVVRLCPLHRVAAIRYESCLLRYSDRPFLTAVEDESKVIVSSPQNTSDVFNRQLRGLVIEITTEAVAGTSKFAVGVKEYDQFGEIYGLAQCTRDLSESSCNQCLSNLIMSLPGCGNRGRLYAVSCVLRFEVGPFFAFSVLRSPPSPPLHPPPSHPWRTGKQNSTTKIFVIAIPSVVAAIVSVLAMVICLKRRRTIKKLLNDVDEQQIKGAESTSFSFKTLRTATRNFCATNKLGEGGFGPVYKGVLPDGQQIAVKRLSRSSGQGLIELRNEVASVAKLHHRNLVRLLGFCLKEEKMVVYEYLPNTSLDKFLFDPIKRLQLDWERRYKLVEGIARGLIYLHEDTRLHIVHRDLKASNILLDERMNPKISDFGLAKIFGVDETQGNTQRIAGTYGYMAPEYAMHGHFSTKSDVFSYGVLVLEIVTGRRNSGFQECDNATDLPSYVWHHWNEGTALQLLDPSIVEPSRGHEVLRCIHIGLLCIQEDPTERPNMSAVCHMLSNSVMLPAPSRPAFLRRRLTRNYDVLPRDNKSAFSKNENPSQDTGQQGVQSVNVVTISDLQPR